ncbi:MAG: class I SAM-dependent methyltransferase [Candidatus Promineifilaceae bacterium]
MKYIVCNLCGADNWRVRFPSTLNKASTLDVDVFRCTSSGYGTHAQIVECHECGYVYANPTWEPDELLSAYETVEDKVYVAERAGRELTFRKHLESLETLSGPANNRTLLDVGAYIGVFVEIARDAGWDAIGVEPSEWAVEEGQRLGLPLINGTMEAAELQGKQFDIVTMFDVIEHVTDPAGELQKAYQLLKPGGMIVVHTMDIDSLAAKLMRGRWPWLMSMHIHFFSQRTLSKMLEQCGFEVLRSRSEGRYLRLGYLATRVNGLNSHLGRLVQWGVDKLRLSEAPVPVNFGDLFTVVAIRPKQDPNA